MFKVIDLFQVVFFFFNSLIKWFLGNTLLPHRDMTHNSIDPIFANVRVQKKETKWQKRICKYNFAILLHSMDSEHTEKSMGADY